MAEYTPEDIEKNKTMGAIAWWIFFLPWLTAKDSEFHWACARRGLLLTIASAVFYIIGLGWIFNILQIWGLIQGFGGKVWTIPLIDKFADDWFGGFMSPKA